MKYEWLCILFFFKQKTAYEMRISDWSSDVCSSDLVIRAKVAGKEQARFANLHLDGSRSENVAGIPQPGREAPRGLEPLVQRDRLDLIIGRLGIGLGIDRLDRLLVLSILAAVTPLRFAFLDAPGVRQHVVEKITRLRRRIDRPPEALGDKLW